MKTRTVLLIAVLAGGFAMPSAADDLVPPIPFRTGNLSVDYLMNVVRGKEVPPEPLLPKLERIREMGFLRVEDYITFAALEREPGKWDWSYYDKNCDAVRSAGLEYGLYPWLHFTPDWYWTGNGRRLDGFVEARTGKEIRMPSIWAPSTKWLYDMAYGRFAQHFAGKLGYFDVSLPVDYGEVGYPAGMANWVVPVEGAETGLWCGDRFARRDFRVFALGEYNGIEGINKAWGTEWASAADITYPTGPENRRYWLDFVGWYYDSMTDFTLWTVELAQKYFPTLPIAVKIGHGSELYLYGSDYTKVPKLGGEYGFICSYPAAIDYFPCKRIGTACKFYGARTCTEPPGIVDATKEVERIFFDVSLGADEHFNYSQNFLDHPDVVRKYAPLLTGEDPYCPLAVFFPTTTHRLRPEEHFPHRLLVCCNPLRDLADYDVVDELMIRDGALGGYSILVVPEVDVIEEETVPLIEDWVRKGGVLLSAPSGAVETVESKAVPLFSGDTIEETVGEGVILRPESLLGDEEVPAWVSRILRERIPKLRPGVMPFLPDLEPDGVLVCTFPDRVVAYHREDGPKTANLRVPPSGDTAVVDFAGREIKVARGAE